MQEYTVGLEAPSGTITINWVETHMTEFGADPLDVILALEEYHAQHGMVDDEAYVVHTFEEMGLC